MASEPPSASPSTSTRNPSGWRWTPENARRPGTLSVGIYGARVGVPLILETLARHKLRATFFVVGRNVELYPDRVAAIVAGGHEIAVHGYTHTPPARLTPAEEEAELIRASAKTA